jgi:hypothetical protein
MSFDFSSSRRAVMAGAGATALGAVATPFAAQANGSENVASNPLVRQRADAQVFRHDDGDYYMTASVPEYDRLILRRARTLAGLATAPEAVIWRRPTQGKLGGYIWAPELHRINGRWHMYFAAGDASEPFHIRTYVLRCLDRDALTGRWEVLGQLQTPWDTFTLDSTVFSHRGVRYLCWAQQEPGITTNSNLYLAPLATPTTLARPPVRLSIPTPSVGNRRLQGQRGPGCPGAQRAGVRRLFRQRHRRALLPGPADRGRRRRPDVAGRLEQVAGPGLCLVGRDRRLWAGP